MPRRARAGALAVAGAALLCGPHALAAAAASAAGIAFESAPLLALAGLGARVRFAGFAAALGCGCGSRLPPALAVAPFALTWWTFGPTVAIARTLAAAAIGFATSRLGLDAEQRPDPLAELQAVTAAAFVAALSSEVARAHVATHGGVNAWLVAAGALAGLLAPCATSGIAAAAGLRATAPAAAFALLATTGFVRIRMLRGASTDRSAFLAWIVFAIAAAVLCVRGTHGFVNPRFALVAPLGALAALLLALRGQPTRARLPLLPGLVCVLALLTANAAPPPEPAATVPLHLYPGQRVTFTGIVDARGRLVRYAIACCRADAQPLSLELEHPPPDAKGTWLTIDGVARMRDEHLVVRVDSARRVTAPSDPFMYL